MRKKSLKWVATFALKPGYIEFGVLGIHSAISIQLLLTRRVRYCSPVALTIAERMAAA